jgi:hypothetical protein
VKHKATSDFWYCYRSLPKEVQDLADKIYELIRDNPYHPSIHLKKVGQFWSARIGLNYRAVGVEEDGAIAWFWIGSHAEYDKLLG